MSSNERQDRPKDRDVFVPPMLFFKKPSIGLYGKANAKGDDQSYDDPLQISFPSGGYGMGINTSVTRRPQNNEDSLGDTVMIASEPENFDVDILERRGIIYSFVCIALINLIVTIYLYSGASTIDPSKVVAPGGGDMDSIPFKGAPFVFEEVSVDRRPIENASYTCIIVATILGTVSALFESPLGLSCYALVTTLNFLLGTSALPYFFFAFRYVFDLWLLYLALQLRSKVTMNFLNMRIFRI